MVELKTDASIDAMYETGQVVAQALTAVRKAADVGVSLLELDEVAREVLNAVERDVAVPRVPAHVRAHPVPRRDLRVGERRDRARHPDHVPAA